MEKNEFLLCNEVIYHIHTCRSMDELKRTILAQTKLLIPCAYASIIAVEIDPATKAIRHSDPFCLPESFTALEREWIARDYQDESLWVSHAPESIVVRGSEIMGDGSRLASPIYRDLYLRYNIYDSLSMNLAYDHEAMALLTLYRTREDGPFTDQDAFYLRALSLHINYAYFMMSRREERQSAVRTLAQLAVDYQLTRREEEILGLIFRGLSNEEILNQVFISRHTLLKHLQNLYRKCGVSSRLELLRLRP